MLSYGAGQESSALLYLYINDPSFRERYVPGRFIVVMSDTGNEHDETYATVERVKRLCEREQVEFYLLTPDMGYHSPTWPDLVSGWRRNRTVGSKAFVKSCTQRLKTGPIYDFLESYLNRLMGTHYKNKKAFYDFADRNGNVRMIIGIATGEEKRIAETKKDTRPVFQKETVERIYPLIDLKMDRRACQRYVASLGEPVPAPSNCIFCPWVSKKELLLVARERPDRFEEWVALEQAKFEKFAHKREKNVGVWGNRKSLRDILAEAEIEHGHMTIEELRADRFNHGHCVQTAY